MSKIYIAVYRPMGVLHIVNEQVKDDIVTLCGIKGFTPGSDFTVQAISELDVKHGKFMCDTCTKTVEEVKSDV